MREKMPMIATGALRADLEVGADRKRTQVSIESCQRIGWVGSDENAVVAIEKAVHSTRARAKAGVKVRGCNGWLDRK